MFVQHDSRFTEGLELIIAGMAASLSGKPAVD
jgi:hypothetical protein